MAVVLGLLVALSYGAGDFLGGLASKRNAAVAVVALSQVVGLTGLAIAVAALGDPRPPSGELVLGAAGGIIGVVGIVLLYRGLAAGRMSVVAPITAVGAAVLPVLWGLVGGERVSAVTGLGVIVAITAVGLVAGEEAADAVDEPAGGSASGSQWKEVALALVAGAAFGALFIVLAETDPDSGLWPVLAARAASVSVVAIGATIALRRVPRAQRRDLPLIAGAGLFDAGANALFVLAVRRGLLAVVSVISSLYPAATVALARVVLGERTSRRQQVGLTSALVGVVLIAVG